MKETVKPRGKPLSGEEMKQVCHVVARPQVKYAWAVGVAMSHFLAGLKQGKILGRTCVQCERILVPPRMFCERCYRTTDEWVELPGTGVIETFSISYIDTDANRIKEPIFVGVLAFDGAPPHSGIMHYFGEVSQDAIHIGMPVEPVWKPGGERVGAITDIKYFRPREGARPSSNSKRRKRG